MDNQPVIQTTNTPIEPLSPPPSSGNYFKYIMAGIGILAVFISGGLFLGKTIYAPKTPLTIQPTVALSQSTPTIIPTTDPTANWMTYINKKEDFSFKYPGSWEYGGDSNFLPDTFFFSPNKIEFTLNAEGPITPVTLSIIQSPTTIDEEIRKFKNANKYNNYQDETIRIGTISARKISGIVKAESYITDKFNIEVFIPKGKSIIILSFIDGIGALREEFDQILSTFKFTDK